MTQIIEIIIAPDGQTKLETKGFAGSSCQHASRFLEEALGQKTSEAVTPEFHKQQAGASVRQGQG